MLSFTSAAVIIAIALLVPLAIRLSRLPVPDIVGQIVAGIVIGPQLLGWAEADAPVQVLALLGLAFLLLLGGMEVDVRSIRGTLLSRTLGGYLVSFALALTAGWLLWGLGFVHSPLLIAVTLSATSLGIVLPILADAEQLASPVGRAVVAGASVAEVVPIVLLSVLFSAQGGGVVAPLVLLVAFLALVGGIALVIAGVEGSGRLRPALVALQETTSEIRVRGTVALLMLFATLATRFGLEAILGSFLAGATLSTLDQDQGATHTLLRVKLRAIGFGVFIPFFFVSTGMALDVRALVEHPAVLARVPVFLFALLVVRAVPLVLYRNLVPSSRQLLAAGLLQATSLSVPVVAGSLGVELGLLTSANYAALVAAGLLSVLLFPVVALRLLRQPALPPAAQPPRSGDGEPAVDDDRLPGHVATGVRDQPDQGRGELRRVTHPAQDEP